MASDGSCLGVCYADNHLFYSVNNPEKQGHLKHVGSFDFNFNVRQAIIQGDETGFPALKTSLEQVKESFNCHTVKILSPAIEECWTIVPRSVYEDSGEREACLSLFMHGLERNDIETVWHPISNNDQRLLLLRNRTSMHGFNKLLGAFPYSEYVAEFEIGSSWQEHSNANGSFLMIHCQKDYLSVSSFILGKLRGCTYIRFESMTDLPYLWNLFAARLLWMRGIHEVIHTFGEYSSEISEILTPYWDDSDNVLVMNSLKDMQADAQEKTYGFKLESAFPAIMMCLNIDNKTD